MSAFKGQTIIIWFKRPPMNTNPHPSFYICLKKEVKQHPDNPRASNIVCCWSSEKRNIVVTVAANHPTHNVQTGQTSSELHIRSLRRVINETKGLLEVLMRPVNTLRGMDGYCQLQKQKHFWTCIKSDSSFKRVADAAEGHIFNTLLMPFQVFLFRLQPS